MAEVIFETVSRGQHQHYKITKFPTTIGRAFDNDIILSDLSVSPHHLEINKDEKGYSLRNISEENGTLLNKKKMDHVAVAITLPTSLQIGDLKARVLSQTTPVEATRIKSQSKGLFRILSNPLSVAFLFLLTLGLIIFDRYQSIPIEKNLLFYANQLLPTLFILLGIALAIAGVSRLSTHRWEILSALGIASLFFLIPLGFDHIGHFLDYFFTSDTPSTILKNISHFLVLPALLMFYMIRVHLTPKLPALGAALLVSSPISAYHINDAMDQLSAYSGFSQIPLYNQTLSSLDIRMDETISLDRYFEDADTLLATEVSQMLEEELEKAKE
ncbi:MAG: hypothetical protein DSZ29_06740 [Aquificaceae bacterium]|nr:MAG: hypothetical protein DSZ29_06740 [Aquificaceae bacterium]